MLLPDVRRGPHAAWPVFAEFLLELEVSALFVFPLVLGALDIGVAELYRSESGPLASRGSMALQLADEAIWLLLRQLLDLNPGDGTDAPADNSPCPGARSTKPQGWF